MSKMSISGKHHADAVFVAAVDGFLVADGAAGLHDGRNACFVGQFDAILEGEESIGGQNCIFQVEIERLGLLNGLAQGIHTRGLPNARGIELLALGQNNGVTAAVLHNLVGKNHIFHFVSSRGFRGDDLEIGSRFGVEVAVLQEVAIQSGFHGERLVLVGLQAQHDTVFL